LSCVFFFFFSSRRRHTRFSRDWSSDVCSSDLSIFIPIGESSQDDRQYYGNGIPDVNLGWNNSFNYKNIDFSFSFRGSFGHQVLRSEERRVGKECRSWWTAYHDKQY